MKNIEILQKVADLVGFKFGSYNFAEVELEGGLVISNQTEGDFMLGDVISVKNEDGTYTIVGSGEHRVLDGRVFITDEEGKLVEIREEEKEEAPEISVEVETEEQMEEVSVEVPEEVVDVMSPDVVEAVVEALTPIVEELKVLTEEMKKLKKDYEGFKASSAYEPLKEDKVIASAFSTDHRYNVLREMKAKMRK